MSYMQELAAWQREWMERYEPDPEVGYPLNDITPWWDTGELVYARVKPGAPPRPRRQRNPAIDEAAPFKAGDLVFDTRCAELRTVDRVFRYNNEWMLDMTTMDRIPIKHIRASWVKHAP